MWSFMQSSHGARLLICDSDTLVVNAVHPNPHSDLVNEVPVRQFLCSTRVVQRS